MTNTPIPASTWVANLDSLRLSPPRARLLHDALEAFLNLYGDGPLRVFRSPGRINLRGMHVDTHGGYLNLMTHQREVLVLCRPREDGEVVAHNLDPRHPRVHLHDGTRDLRTETEPSSWGRYIEGAIFAARATPIGLVPHLHSGAPAPGADLLVASNLPEGAALSSSSALCVATYLAACGLTGYQPSEAETILACRSAEWHTGARTGTSDPAAMVLGRAGQIAHIAMLPERFSLDTLQRAPFPEDELSILVINSHTKRSLNGAQKIAYVANRFAYSLALDVLKKEMADLGFSRHCVEPCDRLSNINPALFGGVRFMGAVLLRVPESLDLDSLQARYQLDNLEALRQQYFSTLPREEWPTEMPLRGPLVYGIAESARAEKFFNSIQSRDWATAGRMMTTGHNGDRIITPMDEPHNRRVHPLQLANFADDNLPLEDIPGDYGASAPVLDAIVDTALKAGALGASLTGAGIAGSVLALCHKQDAARVGEACAHLLTTQRYAKLAAWGETLDPALAEACVVENISTCPAGELRLP